MDTCYICDSELPYFMTTPILEIPDGTYQQFCEKCADREFPGWREDDDSDW